MRNAMALSLAAGAWAAAWVPLPLLAYLGVDRRAVAELTLMLEWAAGKAGLSSAGLVGAAMLLAFAAFSAASLLLLRLVARLDPARSTMDALRWVRRTLWCWLAWIVLAGLATASMLALEPALRALDSVGWALSLLPLVGVFALLPLLILRGDIVARERPPALWAPRLPRLRVALLGMAWGASAILLDLLSMSLPSWLGVGAGWLLVLACELAVWLLGLWIAALVIGAWLRSTGGCRTAARSRLPMPKRTTLFALAAADLRLTWLLLFALPPAMLLALHAIFVIPQVEATLQAVGSAGQATSLRVIASAARWVGEWVWVGALACAWPLLAWSARIVETTQAGPSDAMALAATYRSHTRPAARQRARRCAGARARDGRHRPPRARSGARCPAACRTHATTPRFRAGWHCGTRAGHAAATGR